MAVTIPLRNDLPDFAFQVDLDGATYGLRFFWNYMAEAWFVDLLDSSGNPIVQGSRAVVSWPLFKRYATQPIPPGVLWLLDTSGSFEEAGRNDLGVRVQLLYFPADGS